MQLGRGGGLQLRNRERHVEHSMTLTTFHFLPRDAQCGKLLCQGGEQNPSGLQRRHVVTMDSTVLLGGHGVACQGVFVLPDTRLDQLDLGLVEPGTRCGPKMVSPAYPTPPGH